MPKLHRLRWLALLFVLLVPDVAFAAAGGGTMPWDRGLTTLVQDLTGTLAYSLTVLGLLAVGAMLVFAHDLNRFMQGIIFIILAGSLMVAGATILSALGLAGAVI